MTGSQHTPIMMHLYSIIDLVSDDVRPSDTMFNQFPRPTRVAHFASPRLMNAQLESAKISQYSFTPVLEAGSGCGGKWRSHPQSLAGMLRCNHRQNLSFGHVLTPPRWVVRRQILCLSKDISNNRGEGGCIMYLHLLENLLTKTKRIVISKIIMLEGLIAMEFSASGNR